MLQIRGEKLRAAYVAYLAQCEHIRGLSPKTVKNYRQGLNRFFKWLKTRELNLTNVDEYHLYLKKSYTDNSIHTEKRIIRAFIAYLAKSGCINEDWSSDISMPKIRASQEFIPSQKQALEIIAAGTEAGRGDNSLNRTRKVNARETLVFIVLTGLRQVEIKRLKPSDFDLKNEEFKVVSKGLNEDKLPLKRDLVELIKSRISRLESGEIKTLFESTESHLNTCVKRGCKKLGIPPITVHKLRKVFGTELARRNVSPLIISRLLRHKNIQITYNSYIRNTVEDLKLVVNSSQESSSGTELTMTLEEISSYFKKDIESKDLKNIKGLNLAISEDSGSFSINITKV